MVLAGLLVAPAAAAPSTLRATIHEDFGRRASARPCVSTPTTVTCAGDGIVPTVGRVTTSATYDGTPDVIRIVTFADGSTVTLRETYTEPTFPGRSQDAPGALVSFGNPGFQTFTWVVTGSTGSFTGLQASGTGRLVFAGDTLTFTFVGTITGT
jgi:hypothetical protein